MGDGAPATSQVPVTFMFETEHEAHLAVEALVAAGKNDELPLALRNALFALHPVQRGAEVDADAAVLMTDENAMRAAVEIMKQRAGVDLFAGVASRGVDTSMPTRLHRGCPPAPPPRPEKRATHVQEPSRPRRAGRDRPPAHGEVVYCAGV